MPSFDAASAYLAKASHVHASCCALCSSFAGYIACRSRPCCLNQPIRAQGGLVWVPELLGTATQCPFAFARYSQVASTAPFLATSRCTTSSIGSSESAMLNTSQLKNASASWPVLACASAAPVICSLLPVLVMKSAWASTLFFSAQASTCFCITSLPPGTQWSQKPIDTFPAAPAVRMCTSGSAVAAAPSFNAVRRENPLC